MGERIFMQLSQLLHGIEQFNRRRKWYTQMVTFPYEFDLPYALKSDRILVGSYTCPKMGS